MSARRRGMRPDGLRLEKTLLTRSEIYGALVFGLLILVFLVWSWWTR